MVDGGVLRAEQRLVAVDEGRVTGPVLSGNKRGYFEVTTTVAGGWLTVVVEAHNR